MYKYFVSHLISTEKGAKQGYKTFVILTVRKDFTGHFQVTYISVAPDFIDTVDWELLILAGIEAFMSEDISPLSDWVISTAKTYLDFVMNAKTLEPPLTYYFNRPDWFKIYPSHNGWMELDFDSVNVLMTQALSKFPTSYNSDAYLKLLSHPYL